MIQSSFFKNLSEKQFEQSALETFRFQATHCKVYHDFIDFLKVDVNAVSSIDEIPFLPIQFFKSHQVISSTEDAQQIFLSSGTTGSQSQHFVTDISLYEESTEMDSLIFTEILKIIPYLLCCLVI